MNCKHCGAQITEGQTVCPQCGAPQVQDHETANTSYNALCIAGLVVGVISWFVSLFGIVGIVGIILSVIGVTQCSRRKEKGKALGIAGIILSAATLIIAVVSMTALFM